jgi:uncharacterized membrane protein YhaH (DUF805 family)
MIVSIVLVMVDNLTGTLNQETGYGLLSGLYSLAVLIPSIAVAFRRLHDTGRSAWWLLIALIPIIGWIVIIVFLVQDSHEDENEYGVSPKLAV